MNTKWFSGIGLAILLSTGTLLYTTKTQARPTAPAAAATAAPDPTLENLATCATEKNPAYVEGVLKGAMNAFDKDAQAAIKAGKPANFKKAANNLLKVIKFLFVQSKHFSPIYKDAAHKPTFDKDIDKLIQSLLHAEYALAKSQSAQKEVIKDYTALVAELTKDGVAGLTKIAAPSEKAATGILAKMKGGVSKAGSAIAGGAKKAAAGAKAAAGKVKAKITHKPAAPAADDSAAPAADDSAADDSAADDSAADDSAADDSAAPAADDTPAADDSAADDSAADAPADLQTEEAGTFEPEEEAPAEETPAEEPADLQTEEAGTFEPEDPDTEGAEAEQPVADEEAPAESSDSGDESASEGDSGDESDSEDNEPAEEEAPVEKLKGAGTKAATDAAKKALNGLFGG